MSEARARHPWWLPLAAWAGAGLVRLLGASWRIERTGRSDLDAMVAQDARGIYALWHAHLLPLVYTHRGRGVAVLVSQHRDGELIARIIERLGFHLARGSSTRGGAEGFRGLLRWSHRGHLLAITPDGPRGPARVVKEGLVLAASRMRIPIIPIGMASSNEWVMRSWDRFRVPRPFARVLVGYGEPIRVAESLDETGIEAARLEIEHVMQALADRLVEQASSREPRA